MSRAMRDVRGATGTRQIRSGARNMDAAAWQAFGGHHSEAHQPLALEGRRSRRLDAEVVAQVRVT